MLVCLYLLQNAAKVSYKMPQHFFFAKGNGLITKCVGTVTLP